MTGDDNADMNTVNTILAQCIDDDDDDDDNDHNGSGTHATIDELGESIVSNEDDGVYYTATATTGRNKEKTIELFTEIDDDCLNADQLNKLQHLDSLLKVPEEYAYLLEDGV